MSIVRLRNLSLNISCNFVRFDIASRVGDTLYKNT